MPAPHGPRDLALALLAAAWKIATLADALEAAEGAARAAGEEVRDLRAARPICPGCGEPIPQEAA